MRTLYTYTVFTVHQTGTMKLKQHDLWMDYIQHGNGSLQISLLCLRYFDHVSVHAYQRDVNLLELADKELM